MLAQPTPSRPVPFSVKLAYSAGALTESVKALTFGLFLLFFYTSVRGLSGTLVGTATAIVLAWDALVDPLVGRISDKTRLRFGRRHSFMLWGAILITPTFYAIFSPPGGLSGSRLAIWLIATSLLLRTAQSVFNVPYYALGAELSSNYHERTVITGIRAVAGMAGAMAAAVFSFLVFFPQSAPGTDPKFNPEAYSSMALTFGLLMSAGGLVATVGTLGERYRLRTADADHEAGKTAWREFLPILSNRPFVLLTLSNSLFFLAVVLNATLAMHYLTYYAGIRDSSNISIFQGSFYCGALVGAGVWMRLDKIAEKHHLYFAGCLGTAVVLALAYFLVGEGRLFGTGSLTSITAGHGFAGLCAAALWVIPHSMVADNVDEQKRRTGSGEAARLFGVFSLAHQTAAGLALALSGYLLDHFAGLVPGTTTQSPSTVDRIGILYGLLPSALLVVSAFLILPYSLTRERLRQIQGELGAAESAKDGDPALL